MEEITFTGYISITLRVKIITVLALYKINDCAFHITIKIYEYCKSKEKKSSSSIQQGCCHAELVQIYPEVGGLYLNFQKY